MLRGVPGLGANGEGLSEVLRALAMFEAIPAHISDPCWQECVEAATEPLREALRSNPEHCDLLRCWRSLRWSADEVQRAMGAFSEGKWREADGILSDLVGEAEDAGPEAAASSSAPPLPPWPRFSARCLAQRAAVRTEIEGQWEAAVCDCVEALRLDPTLEAAAVNQARALQKLERWDEAVKVLEVLHASQGDEASFWKMEWAKFEQRRVVRPDYYAVLGVAPDATHADIRVAYKRRSAEVHPDKQMQRGGAEEAFGDGDGVQAGFQLVAEAFEIVGTPEKRVYFDKGYDAPGIRECLLVRRRAAGRLPCSLCGEEELGRQARDGTWHCNACLTKEAGVEAVPLPPPAPVRIPFLAPVLVPCPSSGASLRAPAPVGAESAGGGSARTTQPATAGLPAREGPRFAEGLGTSVSATGVAATAATAARPPSRTFCAGGAGSRAEGAGVDRQSAGDPKLGAARARAPQTPHLGARLGGAAAALLADPPGAPKGAADVRAVACAPAHPCPIVRAVAGGADICFEPVD